MKAKNIISIALLSVAVAFTSCEKLVEGINDDPNNLSINAVNPGLFLNGAELANIAIQLGPISRVAGFYSGQLIGFEQIERERFIYNITSSTFDWDGYQTVISPLRVIQERTKDNPLYQGITKVLEANLIGIYASMFGDVPYTEAVTTIGNPVFDDQIALFNSLQALLQEAVEDLESAAGFVVVSDYIFNGNRIKWLETAYTLKARFYMYTREYDKAYLAAQNGISVPANSMKFVPVAGAGVTATKNKLFIVLSNAPSIGTGDSYMMQLLDPASPVSRNNTKTNEEARRAYYTIDKDNPIGNLGIANQLEPQPIITYQENKLILAEAGARTAGFATGLGHLNDYRSILNTGTLFNSSVSALVKIYDSYTEADFESGGIENPDGILPIRALLREIVEERYISGFTTFMPYDDSRRLRKSDSDISVPFPLNVITATQNIERLFYPYNEVASNTNSPVDPGLFTPTKVNQ